jgi:hypothetical protein
MNRDFEIVNGIYLVQPPHELDLHNDFDFLSLHYSLERRTALLSWRRSAREGVHPGTPASLSIEFRDVSEFRFLPRDATVPNSEDDCVGSFGYWTDEDWADGVIVVEPNQTPDPRWLTAIEFMSGAIIAVRAASATVKIKDDS